MAKKPETVLEKSQRVRTAARYTDLMSADEIKDMLILAGSVIDDLVHRNYLARMALDYSFSAAADGEILSAKEIKGDCSDE